MKEMSTVLDEGLGSNLFTPECMLPEQFFDRSPLSGASGERALQWAVLADGIDTFRRFAHTRSRVGRREFSKAKAWIHKNEWSWIYSFVNLCTTFGFDPSAVRQALQAYEHQGGMESRERRRFRHAA